MRYRVQSKPRESENTLPSEHFKTSVVLCRSKCVFTFVISWKIRHTFVSRGTVYYINEPKNILNNSRFNSSKTRTLWCVFTYINKMLVLLWYSTISFSYAQQCLFKLVISCITCFSFYIKCRVRNVLRLQIHIIFCCNAMHLRHSMIPFSFT